MRPQNIDFSGRSGTIEKSTLYNGAEIHIRPAVPDDAPALLAYLNRVGGESDNLLFGRDGFPVNEAEERAFLAAKQADSVSLFLLGFVEETLAAVASLEAAPRERLSHTAELALTVARAHWGQGAGSAMMDALLRHARTEGKLELVHLAVRADNTAAIHLYKKFGFVKTGILPGFIRINGQHFDEILMTLELRHDSHESYHSDFGINTIQTPKHARSTGDASGQPQTVAPTIREANLTDLPALLGLYAHLHDESPLTPDGAAPVWRRIMHDPDQHLLLAEQNGGVVASCTLLVVPNLTRGGRPWALVENMVTTPTHRRRGLGHALLAESERIAICYNCYKIMLCTGRKDSGILAFYASAGFSQNDKTAFIRRL